MNDNEGNYNKNIDIDIENLRNKTQEKTVKDTNISDEKDFDNAKLKAWEAEEADKRKYREIVINSLIIAGGIVLAMIGYFTYLSFKYVYYENVPKIFATFMTLATIIEGMFIYILKYLFDSKKGTY